MNQSIRTVPQLASILQGHRKQVGLTQAQAASKVGLLAKTISGLETNPGSSSIASLFKLLSALDLELVLKPKDESRKTDDEGW
jgi:HTH-type transcriptional regulator/antitoxin HipB